jgi:hypothetical protein
MRKAESQDMRNKDKNRKGFAHACNRCAPLRAATLDIGTADAREKASAPCAECGEDISVSTSRLLSKSNLLAAFIECVSTETDFCTHGLTLETGGSIGVPDPCPCDKARILLLNRTGESVSNIRFAKAFEKRGF